MVLKVMVAEFDFRYGDLMSFSSFMRFSFGLQSVTRVLYDVATCQPCGIVPRHALGRGDISISEYIEQGGCLFSSRIRRRLSILYLGVPYIEEASYVRGHLRVIAG